MHYAEMLSSDKYILKIPNVQCLRIFFFIRLNAADFASNDRRTYEL